MNAEETFEMATTAPNSDNPSVKNFVNFEIILRAMSVT